MCVPRSQCPAGGGAVLGGVHGGARCHAGSHCSETARHRPPRPLRTLPPDSHLAGRRRRQASSAPWCPALTCSLARLCWMLGQPANCSGQHANVLLALPPPPEPAPPALPPAASLSLPSHIVSRWLPRCVERAGSGPCHAAAQAAWLGLCSHEPHGASGGAAIGRAAQLLGHAAPLPPPLPRSICPTPAPPAPLSFAAPHHPGGECQPRSCHPRGRADLGRGPHLRLLQRHLRPRDGSVRQGARSTQPPECTATESHGCCSVRQSCYSATPVAATTNPHSSSLQSSLLAHRTCPLCTRPRCHPPALPCRRRRWCA